MSSKFQVPTIQQLFDEWDRDSKIDTTNPKAEVVGIPVLHAKYNKWLSMHKLAAVKADIEYNKLYKLKWMYYNGKMNSPEELAEHGWEPFRHTILKPDTGMFIEADQDVADALAKVKLHEECVSFCTYVMKELNSRTFQMKEWMAWERFERGENR